MNCALCLSDRPLCQSHILPEFLYESIYDEKHRLKLLSVVPEKPTTYRQKGLKERLLCEPCEQRLSVWEGYARKALFGGMPISATQHGRLTKLTGLDYTQFKLFQLSILWRAGVSRQEFFSQVDLGPHQEVLRGMLERGDPGPVSQYGCIMFGLEHEGKAFIDVVVPPSKTNIAGHRSFKFVFGGFLWVMLVSSHPLTSPMLECTLHTDGTTMIMIRRASEMKNLVSFSRELTRLGRAT